LILTLGFSLNISIAQKYTTKTGTIRFFSVAPAENIEAFNHQVNSAIDIVTGDFVFRVLMKGFRFEKALMQEHFNENYVESHKFPNAKFIGTIDEMKELDLTKNGIYEVSVSGNLTIHGITKKVKEKGTLEVKYGIILAHSVFFVKVADYEIKIPKTVMKNIAESIEVTVDVSLTALNN